MQKKQGRLLRLPNGFGSIVTQKGRRRKPYIAYTKTTGYDDKGYQIRKILGYFETYEDAYACLIEYNKSPYDLDALEITFAELADMYLKKKSTKLAQSSINTYNSFLKIAQDLNDKKVASLKAYHLQAFFDGLCDEYKWKSIETLKKLMHGIFELGVEYDIINKNPVSYVDINKEDDTVSGVPFTLQELRKLWEHVDDVTGADAVLVMCYSGFRVLAYKDLKIDFKNKAFFGGVKTQASKERCVPIHSDIMPLVERLARQKRLFGERPNIIRDAMPDILQKCGVDVGIFPYNHTPHDCRHTFATLLHRAGVDRLTSNKLTGHSTGESNADKYVHFDIESLREAVEKIKI